MARTTTPEWATFLEAPGTSTFRFAQDGIRFTARRERQGRYWYAYKRCRGRLRKVYLGKTAELSRERLVLAAREFADMDSHHPVAGSETLPTELTSFVGRLRELRELKQHLADRRLITLTGFGGVGKTRLALRLAREVMAEFPGGVCLVDLSPLQQDSTVAATIASALGVRHGTRRPLIDQLVERVRERKLLLILDNCEHVLDRCAQIVDALLRGCPNVSVLTTSREPLNVVGELRFEVEPLPVPDASAADGTLAGEKVDAVRLFMERAVAVRPDVRRTRATARAIVAVCRLLDGIPLAIELAAASLGGLSIEALAAQLARRVELSASVRGRPPRQRTLVATLDWSYQLLTEDQQCLLRRLSVFAGGWTLEAAREICADDAMAPNAVSDTLVQLVDRSLVRAEHAETATRYQMLQLVRDYANNLLVNAETAGDLRRRHRDYFLRLASTPASPRWTQNQKQMRLRRELANVRAALKWSADNVDEVEDGLRLAYAVRLVWHAGMRHEGFEWLARLLAIAPTCVTPSVRATAMTWCGHLAATAGDAQRGRQLLEESVDCWRTMSVPSGLGEALAHLGTATLFDGDAPAAIGYLEEARTLAHASGDKLAEDHSLYSLGYAWLKMRKYDRAERMYARALELQRAIGGDGENALCLYGLGVVALQRGDHRLAGERCLQGLEIYRRANNAEGVLHGTASLAWVAIASGRVELGTRLLGAVDAASSRGGFGLHAVWAAWQSEALDAARASLGPAAFARAWASGEILTLDRAASRAAAFARRLTAVRVNRASMPELSSREAEVAALVSSGMTNAEIARELVITERTAASHVSSILARLGLARRAQIGTWVSRSTNF